VTHDLLFALELCDRSALMADGRIVADTTTVDLLADAVLLRRHGLEMPLGLDPREVLGRHRANQEARP
jgi:cobalt/nickel transport system ATP-binding protein